MLKRTAEDEHAGARNSAYYTVKRLGRARVADIMREQGICELRAKLALEQLVKRGRVRRCGWAYEIVPKEY
jgi:predicted DNA-binding transcriptional regulator